MSLQVSEDGQMVCDLIQPSYFVSTEAVGGTLSFLAALALRRRLSV